MQSVRSFAKQCKIAPETIAYRMTALYGLKQWQDYTLEEVQSLKIRLKNRPMKRILRK